MHISFHYVFPFVSCILPPPFFFLPLVCGSLVGSHKLLEKIRFETGKSFLQWWRLPTMSSTLLPHFLLTFTSVWKALDGLGTPKCTAHVPSGSFAPNVRSSMRQRTHWGTQFSVHRNFLITFFIHLRLWIWLVAPLWQSHKAVRQFIRQL